MPENNDGPGKSFNLIDELARGAIYRGGEEKEQFLTGYAQGVVFWVVLFAALWIVGYVKQQFQ
jgi:hypothetical protein